MKNKNKTHINTVPVKLLKLMLLRFAEEITGHSELAAAFTERADEARVGTEGENDFTFAEMASRESGIIYDELLKNEASNPTVVRKMKKGQVCELLTQILDNDELFEILVFEFFDDANEIMSILGCARKLALLRRDPVFNARQSFISSIRDYCHAAVNLYGVIHIEDLVELVTDYARDDWMKYAYQRLDGYHAKTAMYSAAFFSEVHIAAVAESGRINVCLSYDGLILHQSFLKECYNETMELEERAEAVLCDKTGDEIDEDDLYDLLDSYVDGRPAPSYRELYYETEGKPRYLPDKEIFLKYADDSYQESSFNVRRLRNHIKKKHMAALTKIAIEAGVSEDVVLSDLLEEIRSAYCMNKADDCMKVSSEKIGHVVDIFTEYGICMDGLDLKDANELLEYVCQAANSERVWANNGHSPLEMMRLMPKAEQMTIVPGSNAAANLLKDISPDSLAPSIKIDLDGNATKIPAFHFHSGMAGGIDEVSERKIYPNDPCPCESGRKFKKCCGR